MQVTELKAKQRSQEWFSARSGKITASEAGAILGLNPWRSADDVMRTMVRETHGYESEFEGNIATDYGTRNEKTAIVEFSFTRNIAVKECGFFQAGEQWLGGSPDGLVGADATVEAKCPFSLRKLKYTSGFKSISEQKHYFAQIQVCLHVTDRYSCYFIQWSPLTGVVVEVVKRDDLWLSVNLPKLYEFYLKYRKEVEAPARHLKCFEPACFDSVDIVDEFFENRKKIDFLKERQAEIIVSLRKITSDEAANFGSAKLIKTVRSGSISYKKVVDDLLPAADLSMYKGASSTSWSLKRKGRGGG